MQDNGSLTGSMITEFTLALATLKECRELAKVAASCRDQAILNSVMLELQDKVISLQASTLDLQERYLELARIKDNIEKELVKYRDWEVEKAKYELAQLGELPVYRLKTEFQAAQPLYDLCANCFERGSKSPLLRLDANKPSYDCKSCGSHCIPFKREKPQGTGWEGLGLSNLH